MTGSKVLRRASVWLAAAAMLPAPLWSFGAAAQSNTAAPQTVPGLDRFNLPPSTRPSPLPTPTSGPIIAPLARPTPTPAPVVTATPTPVPSAVAPPVSATPPATTARRPVPQPTPVPAPDAGATPTPEASAAIPAPAASATPQASATAPAMADQQAGGWSIGLLAAIGVAALALLVAAWFVFGRRRRSERDDAAPAAEAIVPAPAPAAPPSGHITVPSRHRPAEAAEPRLEITLIPRRAGTNLTSAAVDYRVVVRNTGTVAVRDVSFAMYMLSASARQAQDLQTIFAAAIERSMVPPFALEPGGEADLSGIAQLPREQVNVMTIEGRPWFVPVLAMKAEYRWGENVGAPGVATAAHMIGIDRGEGAKMAPFRLDGGPRMHPEVAERRVA